MQTLHRAIAQGLLDQVPGSLDETLENLVSLCTPEGDPYPGYRDEYLEFSTTCRLPSMGFLQHYLSQVTRMYAVGVAIYTEPGGPFPVFHSLPQGSGCLRIVFSKVNKKFGYLQVSHDLEVPQVDLKTPVQASGEESQPATFLSLMDELLSNECSQPDGWFDDQDDHIREWQSFDPMQRAMSGHEEVSSA